MCVSRSHGGVSGYIGNPVTCMSIFRGCRVHRKSRYMYVPFPYLWLCSRVYLKSRFLYVRLPWGFPGTSQIPLYVCPICIFRGVFPDTSGIPFSFLSHFHRPLYFIFENTTYSASFLLNLCLQTANATMGRRTMMCCAYLRETRYIVPARPWTQAPLSNSGPSIFLL
jgi:hypothetical protein